MRGKTRRLMQCPAPCADGAVERTCFVNRVIVVGSPRVDGRSASLADELMYACIEECPEDVVSIVSVASTRVEPCRGCDACAHAAKEAPAAPEKGDPLEPHPAIVASDASLHQCVIDDDMSEVRKHLDAADELIVVSPVYFAGPPAQLKALLDRLQPYYRSDARTRAKRPMILHVIGEGGDPHGYDPLVGTVASAFAVAGFRLESIFDWVGKVSAEGDILGDPEEYLLEEDAFEADDVPKAPEATPERKTKSSLQGEKPRLSLSQPAKGGKPRAPKGDGGRSSMERRRKGGTGKRSDGRGGNGGARRGGRRG